MFLLGDDADRALGELGLTPSRAALVWELGQRGPVPQHVLATALRVTPRAVTGLVDALVASDLVTRAPHPGDRRATLVTFTPRGAELAAGLERGRAELARTLFAPMPAEELDCFGRGLAGVIARLRAHIAAGAA